MALKFNLFHKNTSQIEIAHETKTNKTDLQNRNSKKIKRKTTSKTILRPEKLCHSKW